MKRLLLDTCALIWLGNGRGEMTEEYTPQIFMVALAGGKKVDCYFTNGAVRRFDVTQAIRLGGVFSPLKDQKLFEQSVMVMDGVLAFDLKGDRDPYSIVAICADVVYRDGEAILIAAA